MAKHLTIGTRGSKLALWQAHWIEARLRELGFETSIQVIKTTGDKITDVSLAKVGSDTGLKGVFTKEIEEALLDGSIDLAVHSLKDLPTELDKRLTIGCIPERADPRDVLAGKTLAELKAGDRVGTSSLRRAKQLQILRGDVVIADIRGNVDTRLRKLDEGQFDAILLASAGLHRLGLEGHIAEILEPEAMAPAIGQGALAVEIRADDPAVREALAPLHHQETAAAVTAERALLHALGGGCQVPLGASARVDGDRLTLNAVVVSESGAVHRAAVEGALNDASAIGESAARELRGRGVEL